MTDQYEPFVGLLRGINVGGKNKIPMAELRSICSGIGCEAVKTYIQSGNVIFRAAVSADIVERRLEDAIRAELGLAIPVIVRPAASWKQYLASNPFPDEAAKEANWVLLCLSKRPPRAAAVSELQKYASQGERVVNTGEVIWIHYANGIARSKVTTTILDRHVGSTVTARNWRTALKLEALIGEIR